MFTAEKRDSPNAIPTLSRTKTKQTTRTRIRMKQNSTDNNVIEFPNYVPFVLPCPESIAQLLSKGTVFHQNQNGPPSGRGSSMTPIIPVSETERTQVLGRGISYSLQLSGKQEYSLFRRTIGGIN
jgi:hypothetical protein